MFDSISTNVRENKLELHFPSHPHLYTSQSVWFAAPFYLYYLHTAPVLHLQDLYRIDLPIAYGRSRSSIAFFNEDKAKKNMS